MDKLSSENSQLKVHVHAHGVCVSVFCAESYFGGLKKDGKPVDICSWVEGSCVYKCTRLSNGAADGVTFGGGVQILGALTLHT